jgi:hypothetical protein
MDRELNPEPEKMPKWALVFLAVVVVVALVAFARGQDHHRGDDVGALRRVGTVPQGAGRASN